MGSLSLILTKHVDNLGRAGELVRVKPGYGRNYLIPRGMAIAATRSNVAELEHQKRVIEREQAQLRAEQQKLAEKLKDVAVSIPRKKGQDGKLFGSVNSKDISEALAAQNIHVDRKLIHVDEPFKNEGSYQVEVRFSHEISAQIRVNVIGI